MVRKVKPVEKPFDYARAKPLDQEKSSLSLAEIYEQEFLKQTQVYNACCICVSNHTFPSRLNQRKKRIKGIQKLKS